MRDITKDFEVYQSDSFTRCVKCRRMKEPGTYFAWVVDCAEMFDDGYEMISKATKNADYRSAWCTTCVNRLGEKEDQDDTTPTIFLVLFAILSVIVFLIWLVF